MDIQVIGARVCDAQEMVSIKTSAFSWDVETYGFGPPGFDSLDNQIKTFENPDASLFKVVADGKMIGGACIFDRGSGHYHLGGLYIEKAYQNKGIGTEALMRVMAQFPDAVKWTLETPYKSLRNHHFYEKLGFIKTGKTPPEENGFCLILFEKIL